MENAIRRAIEGGWNDRLYRADTGNEKVWTHYDSLLLDPLFWQALGKACGWPNRIKPEIISSEPNWLHHWHRFIDHLAEGKDVNEFFENLIK